VGLGLSLTDQKERLAGAVPAGLGMGKWAKLNTGQAFSLKISGFGGFDQPWSAFD